MEFVGIMQIIACLGAAGAGCSIASAVLARTGEKRRKAQVKGAVEGSAVDRMAVLGCSGLSARMLRLAIRESVKPTLLPPPSFGRNALRNAAGSPFEKSVLKAGLRGTVTRSGFDSARMLATLAFMSAGAVVGAVFSPELALAAGVGGAFAGWFSVLRALRKEAAVRRERLGSQLGEMVEVVALGLRSGLSFDRAFSLYCEHFDSGFARDCAKAHTQWALGLVSRESALRSLADSYDSAVLSRVVESIVRSLRFGSSLAETLESAAVESRSIHKAEVEERVAKAPIKMLVPVGTLILPAMLIFVLGPIMIDLMNGM